MAAMLQYQQPNIYHSDVTTRDRPRDAIPPIGVQYDISLQLGLLQPSFYDVTDTSQLPSDAWMMTSSMMTSCAADDSGISLSHSLNNDDERIFDGISPPKNPNFNVTPELVTEETHQASVGSPRYDVIARVNVETPVARSSGNPPVGNPCNDVSWFRFSDEQIVCICTALRQKRDFDKLEQFLSTLDLAIATSSRETCDDHTSLPVAKNFQGHCAEVKDAVLSSVADVAFHRGRYDELCEVLQSHVFSTVYHGHLQQLWHEAHYAMETAVRRRALGAVDKYRIRRKHPLPATIWDGEDTRYCFKVHCLQRVNNYAERCISYDRFCLTDRLTVRPSVRHSPVSCQNDSSYDHAVFTGG